MAIKEACYASLSFVGDGNSTSEVTNLNTSSFIFGGIAGAGSPQIFNPLWSAVAPIPTAITNIVNDDGQAVTITIGLLGALTYNWPVAIPNGNIVSVRCILEF